MLVASATLGSATLLLGQLAWRPQTAGLKTPPKGPSHLQSKGSVMNLEVLREFFGWCLMINLGIMVFSTVFLVLAGSWASNTHAKMFGLEATWIRQAYFTYLANYKIAVIVLNLVPWIALNLISG